MLALAEPSGAARRAVRGAAVLVFCALCASGPLLRWLGPHAKTLASVELPALEPARLLDGSLLAAVERNLRESSPLVYHVRGIHCETLQRIGWLDSAAIAFGRDGWWFLRSERTFPAEAFTAAGAARRATYAALHERVRRLGVGMLALLVPDKSRIYRDRLASGTDYPQSREPLHATLASELRGAGIPVVDLLSLYEGLRRAEPETVLWYARDSHWNGAGMAHAAKAVKEELERLGWLERLGPARGIQPLQASYPDIGSDMMSVLGIRPDSAVGRRLTEPRDQFAYTIPGSVGTAPRAQPSAPWALAGTSYSHEGLISLLPIFVGRPIDATSVHNGWLPVRVLREAIARIERREIAPAVLVWEVPERLEIEEPWDEIARELGGI